MFSIADGDIDYLAHYRLVDPGKIEMYAKAFVVEDEDFDAALSYKVRSSYERNQSRSIFQCIVERNVDL
jgi:hypothetical protein